MILLLGIKNIFIAISYLFREYIVSMCPWVYGKFGKHVMVRPPLLLFNSHNIELHDHTNIYGHSRILTTHKKFIMMSYSGAAQGLTVFTSNHHSEVGHFLQQNTRSHDGDEEKDIIVENDVWIASNVTLLMGAHIGRGALIGAGSVVRTTIPPYSIVIGNPAKVIGFKFTPSEIIEHESKLYPVEERLPIEVLERNYNKYFVDRIFDIKSFTGIR